MLTNLKTYSRKHPELITNKYIFTDENSSLSEVQSFFELVKNYDLLKCNCLISANFKFEKLDPKIIGTTISLCFLFRSIGVHAVTFDDKVTKV